MTNFFPSGFQNMIHRGILIQRRINENQCIFSLNIYTTNCTYADIPLGNMFAAVIKIPTDNVKNNPDSIKMGILSHHFCLIIILLYLFIAIFILQIYIFIYISSIFFPTKKLIYIFETLSHKIFIKITKYMSNKNNTNPDIFINIFQRC